MRYIASLVLVLVAAGCSGTTDAQSESPPNTTSNNSDPLPGDAGSNNAMNADTGTSTPETLADTGTNVPDPTDMNDDVDMGATEPGTMPIFVATGDLGRTTISCDDGLTWIANRSYDLEGAPESCGNTTPIKCYDTSCEILDRDTCEVLGSCDCNHSPGAPQGVAYGDGWFLATWGWGPPGAVKRSQNGVDWEVVTDGTSYGGIAFGDGTFMAASRSPGMSSDGGATWVDAEPADLKSPSGSNVYNVRKFGYGAGAFVIAASSGSNRDVLVSRDQGASWQRPSPLPADCADGTQAIAGAGSTIVMTHRDGLVCVSVDGGLSFESLTVDERFGNSLLYADGMFKTWNGGNLVESADGRTWTETSLPGGPDLGAVARNPETGTFVAFNAGWKRWYEDQKAYRSADGINWTELSTDDFVQSHKIDYIAHGRVPAAACE